MIEVKYPEKKNIYSNGQKAFQRDIFASFLPMNFYSSLPGFGRAKGMPMNSLGEKIF